MRFPFRRRREEDLDQEIKSHLDMSVSDRVERGESQSQATSASLREIGNVGLIKEATREMWGWTSIEKLWQDLRYGFRVLRKSPAFTIVAVLSLGLGIGANTAIFSLVDKVLLKSLPVEQPERLVLLGIGGKNGVTPDFNYPDYAGLRDRNNVFDGLTCFAETPLNLAQGGQTERVNGLLVSGDYFGTLRATPAIGRAFLPEEDKTRDTNPVVVISYQLWKREFGSDPGIVGRKITINNFGFTVVGIAPSEFTGTFEDYLPDIYVPMMMQHEAQPGRAGNPLDPRSGRSNWWLYVMGRLKPGVSREQAESALNVISAQLASENPLPNGAQRDALILVLDDGRQGFTEGLSSLKLPLKMLMAIVALVLLIACANVANLLLARSGARQKEIAVRLSIGAGRMRVIRQLLTESLLIAVLGGLAGLLLAFVIGRLLIGFAPAGVAETTLVSGHLDLRLLGFTAALSLVTGLLFGLVPAFAASHVDLLTALKDESFSIGKIGSRINLKNVLVAGQVALSLIVLIGAGLCIRSLQKLQSIDTGFQTAKVLTTTIDMSLNGYSENRGRQLVPQIVERVAALPGVESLSFGSLTPLTGIDWGWSTWPEGYKPQPNERPLGFRFDVVGPDYFRTTRTPIVAGREFTSSDTATSTQVAIINETLARKYFPGQNPIGKHLLHGDINTTNPADMQEIIGVVKDSKYKNLTADAKPFFYCPFTQNYQRETTLFVRTANDPALASAAVRQTVQSIDPTLTLFNTHTLEEVKSTSLSTPRFAATLLTFFGLLALLLAAIGIYGVMSYSVNLRTREIGIRMALGAQRDQVLRMVISQGMTLVAVGLILGVVGAVFASRWITSFLYGVNGTDSITYLVIAVVVTGTALLASYIPARKAMKVDPMVALRYE